VPSADPANSWPVPYWFVDAGHVVMSILLAAVDNGLGACFLGNFRGEEPLLDRLGTPPGWRYVGSVLLGEAGGDDPPSSSLSRPRRDLASMVHYGRW
jgi:nitroreductase